MHTLRNCDIKKALFIAPVLDMERSCRILYAENDNLISRQTVNEFIGSHNAHFTVMVGGEHWFYTNEQFAFLDIWMKEEHAKLFFTGERRRCGKLIRTLWKHIPGWTIQQEKELHKLGRKN